MHFDEQVRHPSEMQSLFAVLTIGANIKLISMARILCILRLLRIHARQEFDALERARIVDTTIVYDFTKPRKGAVKDWTSPLAVCWVLLAISVVVLVVAIRLRRRIIVFDMALLTVTGLTGLVILFLWALTDHRISRWNMNLFWASPLNLMALFSQHFKKFYFSFYSILLVLLAVFTLITPRCMNPAVFPLILALLTRAVSRSIRLTSLAFNVPNKGK